MTPLVLAAQHRPLPATFEALLAAKADLHATFLPSGTDGTTALHYCFNSAEALRYLVSRGADMEFRNMFGQTPLPLLSAFCPPEVVHALLDLKADANPSPAGMGHNSLANLALFDGRLDTARALIEREVDVNAQACPSGLFAGVFAGARLAVSCGATSSVLRVFAEIRGITPLGMAAFTGKASLLALLLNAKADPTIQNYRGHDAMALADLNGHGHLLSVATTEDAAKSGGRVTAGSRRLSCTQYNTT